MQTILRNVRPWGGPASDIRIADGVIVAVSPHDPRDQTISGDPATTFIDGRGLLALPGFINAHAHLDKSWWGKSWVSYGGEATTQGRIEHERLHREALGIPGVESTTALLRALVSLGTTAFRTHVDVDLGVGLDGIRVVKDAVAALGVPVGLEIVAFPQDGVLRRPGVLELLDRAAAEGAEHVGGLDPASIDRDPVGQLDGLFDIADRRGVGIDIHLHDGGELGAFQYELIIERTLATGLAGRVNVAHGFAIGDVSPARQAALIEGCGQQASRSRRWLRSTRRGCRWMRFVRPAFRSDSVPTASGTSGVRTGTATCCGWPHGSLNSPALVAMRS
ncbi:cytosine deaminase [Leifsonia poae]|uniref:cytosine deaminase n=1 Tax=Leifsonia poae TaxID=110933 RepID=UPI003D66C817